jgi:tRNA (guanine-N7-)-methyltransferase
MLPIRHPDFKYPLSRNPYATKLLQLKPRSFVDNDTELNSSKWLSLFSDSTSPKRELHVEIGCNGGHVILEWAAKNPANAYIGLDWKYKQIHRAAEKAAKRNVSNLILLRAHAERIRYVFGNGEIDALYLFFPDPWPRKSQWKNRYVTAENLRLLASLVKPGGTFHIKTDHDEYFDWMEKAVNECSEHWRVTEITRNLHHAHSNPVELQIPDVTLFEKVFIKDGIKIKSLKLRRI